MSKVQETTNPQDEAQRIWDQLDAEDGGQAQPHPAAAEQQSASQEAATDDANKAPAEQADANQEGTPGEQAYEQNWLDKIAGLEAQLSQVTQRLRQAEGHIGGLNSQLKQQQQLAAQVTARGGEAPTAGEIREAQGSAKAMEALKRDYPEFAEAMEAALNEQLQVIKAGMPQTQQQPGVSPEDIARLRAEMAVEMKHPGWQDRVQTPEFVGWLNRQPREVQMLAASESPQDAVRLLDLHAQASSKASTQNQALASAAAIPSGRGGSNKSAKRVEDMSPQEYWAYLDQLEKQKG